MTTLNNLTISVGGKKITPQPCNISYDSNDRYKVKVNKIADAVGKEDGGFIAIKMKVTHERFFNTEKEADTWLKSFT